MESKHVANWNYTRYVSGAAPTGLNATTAIQVGKYGLLASGSNGNPGVKRGAIRFQNAGSTSIYLLAGSPFSTSTQGFALPPGAPWGAYGAYLEFPDSDDQWWALASGTADDLRVAEQT
jgi:hypothetical protein